MIGNLKSDVGETQQVQSLIKSSCSHESAATGFSDNLKTT